jgi:hypothetical protein
MVLANPNYYQVSIGAGFRPSLQPSWFPLIFLSFSRWRSFTVLVTKRGSFFLIDVGSGFYCLRSFVSSSYTWVGLARTIYVRCRYLRYFWQGNHQIYGHIRCIHTVLANPTHGCDSIVPPLTNMLSALNLLDICNEVLVGHMQWSRRFTIAPTLCENEWAGMLLQVWRYEVGKVQMFTRFPLSLRPHALTSCSPW